MSGQRNDAFSATVFWGNMANTIAHSLMTILLVFAAVGDQATRDAGYTNV